jgi:hypothetical protein
LNGSSIASVSVGRESLPQLRQWRQRHARAFGHEMEVGEWPRDRAAAVGGVAAVPRVSRSPMMHGVALCLAQDSPFRIRPMVT